MGEVFADEQSAFHMQWYMLKNEKLVLRSIKRTIKRDFWAFTESVLAQPGKAEQYIPSANQRAVCTYFQRMKR